MNGDNASSSALTAICEDVLEAFLHDMIELDHQLPNLQLPMPAPTKRELVPTSTTNHSMNKKKRSNPSWRKRKRELQALREETQTLETRVAFLKSNQEATISLQEVMSLETLEQQKQLREASEAERQLCQDTQDENQSLRGQLQIYVYFSGALQSVLTAQQDQRAQMAMGIAATKALRIESRTGYQLRLASPSVFDKLEGRVNVRFRELEASFGEAQQQVTTPDSELVQIHYHKTDRQFGTVGFKRTQLLRFEKSAISSTVWAIVEVGGFPSLQESRVIQRFTDTVAVDSQLCMSRGWKFC